MKLTQPSTEPFVDIVGELLKFQEQHAEMWMNSFEAGGAMSEEKIWDWGRVTIGIEKPEKEPTTVDEMRRAMFDASHESSLIRNAFMSAEHSGMSGEDKYAMLAYYALRQLEATHKELLHMVHITPSPRFIAKDDPS